MATFSKLLRARWVTGLLCAVPVVTALGCGADFDSPDKVKTLRVFGVQKDHPYAAPTVDTASPSEVQLTMLSHDGSPQVATPTDPPRTVQRLWFSGCDDLPGDAYFTCLARIYRLWLIRTANHGDVQLNDGESWSLVDDLDDKLSQDERNAALAQYLPLVNPSLPIELVEPYFKTYRIGAGEQFTYPIPPRIIENHRPTTDSAIPPYGLAFVFFTACAGQKPRLELAPEWKAIDPTNFGASLTDATLGFPLICRDETGSALDSDNFIAGYTQQYVYGDGSANQNPVIDDSFTFGNTTYKFRPDTSVPADPNDANAVATAAAKAAAAAAAVAKALCLNDDCVPKTAPDSSIDPCDKDYKDYVPHVKACSNHCQEYELTPHLSPANNNDIDTFTSAGGNPVGEQMWIDYYANQGEFKGSARSLRDATLGWLPDQGQDSGQKWKPPALADAGPALLWAVVHDNRGGVAWLRVQICIDP